MTACVWRRGSLLGLLGVALSITGCGLTIDAAPPDQRADASADSGMGGRDAAPGDTGPRDVGPPPEDVGPPPEDAGPPPEDGGPADTGPPVECVGDGECDDGDPCNGAESCVEGTCLASDALLDCDDGVECTVDACEPFVGCKHGPDHGVCLDAGHLFCAPALGGCVDCRGAADCDDFDVCNGVEVCERGTCVEGAPLACPEVIGCRAGECDPDVGCVSFPVDGACDDGAACTEDACLGDGRCQHTPVPGFCDDFVGCTSDVCRPLNDFADEEGCVYVPVDMACTSSGGVDGCATQVCSPDTSIDDTGCSPTILPSACPAGSSCDLELLSCQPDQLLGTCTSDADCDDFDPCNGREACVARSCVKASRGCPASGDPCIQTYCDLSFGEPVCLERVAPDCLGGAGTP